MINAITERKGVKTALITTEGFRDSLEIARGNRPDFFNLALREAAAVRAALPAPRGAGPPHPRRRGAGAARPLRAAGDRRGLPRRGRRGGRDLPAPRLRRPDATSRRSLAESRELWPEVSVVASHQITREWREYERTSTAVLSAYVQPIAERYLTRLAERHRRPRVRRAALHHAVELRRRLRSSARSRIPITMVESGPASGFWGAAELGRLIGEPNVLALDIGGTTAKCSLIEDGHVRIMTDYWIERRPPLGRLPDHGAGRRPRRDRQRRRQHRLGRRLRQAARRAAVGRRACPGPAAYGRGGTEATTTDANLALGRINRDYFCGGEIDADMAAVERALDAVAAQLGVDRVEAARGIVRIANNNMVNALKLISVNRGYDPRDFTLVAFGGGGGMHAVALAAELGITQGRRPARRRRLLGLGDADERPAARLLPDRACFDLTPASADRLEAIFAELDAARAGAVRRAKGSRPRQVTFAAYAKLRYENQEHRVEIALPGRRVDAAAIERRSRLLPRALRARVHLPARRAGRARRRATSSPSREVGKLEPARLPVTGRTLARRVKGERDVDYAPDGVHRPTIYDGELLEPGMRVRRAGGRSRRRARRSSCIPATGVASTTSATSHHRIVGERSAMRRPRARSDHARDHPELAAGDRATRCSPRCARRR